MSDAVVYEQLDQEAQPPGSARASAQTGGNGVLSGAGSRNGADLRRLSDVLMELSVEIGRTRMTVGEMLQLRAGSIVTLERLAGEPVDLIVEGDPAAANLGEPEGGDQSNAAHPAPPDPAQADPPQPDPVQADPAMQE
jgi:hypothetical protein